MFHAIVENIPLPIIIVNLDRIQYMNAAANELYGISESPDELTTQIMNDIREGTAKIDNKIFSIEMQHHSEQLFCIFSENNHLRNRINLYEDIMNKLTQGITVYDLNERLIYMNDAALRIDSIQRSKLPNSNQKDHFNCSNSSCIKNNVSPIKEEMKGIMCEYCTSDGDQNKVSLDIYPYRHDGNTEYIYSIYQDVDTIKENIRHNTSLYKLFTNTHMDNTVISLSDVIGENRTFKAAKTLASRASKNTSNIMLYGETGTGKELFAQSIHNESLFASGPFVSINCAAVPETLMESIFFGSVKGAFTGATDLPGLFEQAHNGTLFLDEINSMNIILQAKLLRCIQEKRVTRLGSDKQLDIHCRIISSLNKDPIFCINDRDLRDDLFYRLSTVVLEIPPLRERRDDIPVLLEHFRKIYNSKFGYRVNSLCSELQELLVHYDYPGNVRELQHIIESAYNMIDLKDQVLAKHHLPGYIQKKLSASYDSIEKSMHEGFDGHLDDISNNLEKNVILMTLKENGYNITRAARQLGLSRQSLQYRIKKYKLNGYLANK